MAVKTPSYWLEEKYQPLVEAETAFGNKVLIPQSLMDTWEMWERNKHLVLPTVERAKAAGWFKKSLRNQKYQDLMRVYFEQYQ